jgi:lipopolysaccharide biosynthesis regulator YciM
LAARWRDLWARARGRPPAPKDPNAALRAALLCVLDHDLEGAEALLAGIAQADSREVDAYLALARVFRLRGEVGRALRVHQNLLLRSDLDAAQRAHALRGLAEDYRHGGFLERSSETFEQLLADHPRDVPAMRALVRIHRDSGRPERALAVAERLHRATGAGEEGRRTEAELEVEIAERARRQGRSEDARRGVRRALRRDRRSAAAHALLGEIEVERGRSKRALAAWQRALELDRRAAPELYGKLRSGFAALGRAREFEPFLRARIAKDPGDPAPRLALARVLLERGEGDGAAVELRALVAQRPQEIEAHAELGRALAAAGRTDEACAAWAAFGERVARSGALRVRERGLE